MDERQKRLGQLAKEHGAAACATPDGLKLVDAAYERSGGPAAKRLAQRYCPYCPVRDACLSAGMLGEWGVWGGTSQHIRTKQGSAKPSYASLAPRARRSEDSLELDDDLDEVVA